MTLSVKNFIENGKELSREDLIQILSSNEPMKSFFGLSDEDMTMLQYLGYEQFQQGKLDDALTIFKGLEALGSEEAFIFSAIGSILAQKDDLQGALESLSKAIERAPDDIGAFTNRAEVYLRLGIYGEAAGDLKRVIELDANEEDAMAARARVLVLVVNELLQEQQGKSRH